MFSNSERELRLLYILTNTWYFLCLAGEYYHIVAFICTFLVTDKIEKLFISLVAIWIFSPVNCMFLFVFLLELSFSCQFSEVVYIFYIWGLCQILCITIIFPPLYCCFRSLNGVFWWIKFKILMKSNWSTFL